MGANPTFSDGLISGGQLPLIPFEGYANYGEHQFNGPQNFIGSHTWEGVQNPGAWLYGGINQSLNIPLYNILSIDPFI